MSTSDQPTTVPAGALAPWEVAGLPPPPVLRGWGLLLALLGPGMVLASTAIGSGEWLFGPAVTAQYGATLLWMASLSILFQVFCNLLFMRYAIYCGESIIVGGLRTWPGPRLWIPCYLVLEIASLLPFNAAGAAVALAAVCLNRIPGEQDAFLVRALSYTIFLLSFVPLVFGGTVYRTIEKIMTFKIFYVLGYLTLAAVLLVSASNWWEVASGFFRFGTVPLRPDYLVVGKHFHLIERKGDVAYELRGSVETDEVNVVDFAVKRGRKTDRYGRKEDMAADLLAQRQALVNRAKELSQPGRFYVQTLDDDVTFVMEGTIGENQRWRGERFILTNENGRHEYADLQQVPEPYGRRFEELIAQQGLTHINLIGYTREHGQLPPLDWATLAAFISIAGLGGLANTLFSNYARDKGWGMGVHVGAIPSAIGGRPIRLSHVGKVFPLDEGNCSRWRAWMRHIRRDQMVWMVANFIGMALPCLLALEFIRHMAVRDHGVTAMTADGMAGRYPDLRWVFWVLTLFCGFVILAPGQMISCDMVARRWTDIIWTGTRWSKRISGDNVKYLYYGILGLYAVLGLVALSLFNPLQMARIAAVLMNVALGFTALHGVYVNRALMPRELRPSWLLQAGGICCGLFFLGVSVVVLLTL